MMMMMILFGVDPINHLMFKNPIIFLELNVSRNYVKKFNILCTAEV